MKVRKNDIVLIDVDFNFGTYIQKKNRPFLVVSNDIGNECSNIALLCPLTTKMKKLRQPTHVSIKFNNSVVHCEQRFTICQKDINSIIGHLDLEDARNVNYALMVSEGIL